MSDEVKRPKVGTIGWIDLTVPEATGVREFYQAVVGWSTSDIDMGGYSDYCMHPTPGDDPVAGICHARGTNAALPTAWLIYIIVANLDASLRECTARGGRVLVGPRSMGESRYAIIEDPAGAVAALYQP